MPSRLQVQLQLVDETSSRKGTFHLAHHDQLTVHHNPVADHATEPAQDRRRTMLCASQYRGNAAADRQQALRPCCRRLARIQKAPTHARLADIYVMTFGTPEGRRLADIYVMTFGTPEGRRQVTDMTSRSQVKNEGVYDANDVDLQLWVAATICWSLVVD
ncbi:uncharacterized protein B0I36DRAFT_51073 [Microdochium trichocladiopsis]|uniref:Uncharacterized protein n=1 Tax=Microdochium trichocladiopsis TaxID=1682393 RepID=A0A9P8XR89_9PEZI|nr:uncharacterized protein B0I36DRAFT_51073 [Microdochium trichocladiopsis]KAH7012452.1 hypothetical protein B0I36DRAFT_51073 [Microdochium trichocladiopsis]